MGKKVSLEDVCWRCCAVSEGSTILASMGIYFKVKLNSPPKDDCFHEGHRKKNFNLVGQNSHTAASLQECMMTVALVFWKTDMLIMSSEPPWTFIEELTH